DQAKNEGVDRSKPTPRKCLRQRSGLSGVAARRQNRFAHVVSHQVAERSSSAAAKPCHAPSRDAKATPKLLTIFPDWDSDEARPIKRFLPLRREQVLRLKTVGDVCHQQGCASGPLNSGCALPA